MAYGDRWSLAEEIVQHGADVVVLDPAELRERRCVAAPCGRSPETGDERASA